ncbi:MAG: DNA sulfur modification protein DndC [Planctomycetota bacterium]
MRQYVTTSALHEHSVFGADEVKKIREVCDNDDVHFELLRELIDTEQRHRNLARRA